MIRAESSLRGLDQGDHEIFALHFTWSAGMRTSLHKHRGFELVLVRTGRVHAIVDGTRLNAGPAEFIELPAGSAHAIWSEVETTLDVLGQRGLGLTMLVPDGSGHVKEVLVYGSEGPLAPGPTGGHGIYDRGRDGAAPQSQPEPVLSNIAS